MSHAKDLTKRTTNPLIDADEFVGIDKADSSKTKLTLWSTMKAALKTYADSLYASAAHTHTHNSTTGLNEGDYQHLTADEKDEAEMAMVAGDKYLSGN
jgi:hypothetical protein